MELLIEAPISKNPAMITDRNKIEKILKQKNIKTSIIITIVGVFLLTAFFLLKNEEPTIVTDAYLNPFEEMNYQKLSVDEKKWNINANLRSLPKTKDSYSYILPDLPLIEDKDKLQSFIKDLGFSKDARNYASGDVLPARSCLSHEYTWSSSGHADKAAGPFLRGCYQSYHFYPL